MLRTTRWIQDTEHFLSGVELLRQIFMASSLVVEEGRSFIEIRPDYESGQDMWRRMRHWYDNDVVKETKIEDAQD